MTHGINDIVVVITGASSGLGEAAARLSRHGAKWVLIEPLDGKTVGEMEKVSAEPYQVAVTAD